MYNEVAGARGESGKASAADYYTVPAAHPTACPLACLDGYLVSCLGWVLPWLAAC